MLALPRNQSISFVYREVELARRSGVTNVSITVTGRTCSHMGVLGLTPFLHKTWCALLD
jgi:hypothetical protein